MNNLGMKRNVPVSVHHLRNPIHTLQNELNRAVNSLYNVFDLPSFNLTSFENLTLTPSIDIVDSKNEFKVEVEMPGMDEEDVKVSVSDGMLTIKGEKETSKKDQDKNYIMREITYGSYTRSIALPDTVDINKAEATFKKGMLWVIIPKKAEVAKKSHDLKIKKAKEKE